MRERGKLKVYEPGIGSIAYQLAEIAKGSYEGFINYHMEKPYDNWDLAAGSQMVRAAGGKVTGLDGKDYEESEMSEGLVASANEKIHQELLAFIRAVKREEIALGKCA